ncbi:MAG: signal peptide peptidase SppA [Saprospiraceae bacterium]|nr:signal peptide peptidase SppA [Saprospiraceae bacterium]
MKQFFKFLFASCLGTLLAIGALIFIFMIIGSSFSSKDTQVKSKSVLMLQFNDLMPEKTDNVQKTQFDFEPQSAIGVHHIKDLIKKAQNDNNIVGIVYKPGLQTQGGMVKHAIIKEALQNFKDSTDKFIYTYADFLSNATYLMSTPSDSIFVNPNGMLEIKGYAAMIPFFKDMLDRIGVKMNVFYAGNFKSATEPFRRNDMSPSNRVQTREFLTDNYNLFLKEVSESRNISLADLKAFINDFNFENIDAAIDLGLIDKKAYWYEVEDMIRNQLEISEGKEINYIDLAEYESKTFIKKKTSKNRIAVIYAEGDILYDANQRGVVSEVKYHEIFDKIRKDKKVKAVVLRVNSPGGSAFSSDVIWREMEELKSKGIPVIASFGDYAASGGYYIAAGADVIVSHPKTLTGSIGVFSMLPNVTKLFEDKMGIHFDTIKTSPHAISLTPFYDFNEEEKETLQNWTDNLYQKFLSRVAQGRNMTIEEVHEVAQGRVWTGQRAVDKGLVDELGGLDKAIDIAIEKAELGDDYKIVNYPIIKKDVWEQLIADLAQSSDAEAQVRMPTIESQIMDRVKELKPYLNYKEPMARLPLSIH